MSEWIGLIGGLAGTILGWLLGILSLRGRLHIYPEWEEKFECDDEIGGIKACSSREQVQFIHII